MKIIIAGAGAVGTHLAKMLADERHDIVLMDASEERLSNLESNFDLMTIAARPTSINSLKDAGAADADLFVAVTPEESTNITSCILAHSLGAKKTVARIDNYEYLQPKNKEFFKNLGVDSLIYPEMLAAKEIADGLHLSWIRQWWEFSGGALVMLGVKLRDNALILNTPIFQIKKEHPYHIVTIKRMGETIIPGGADELHAGDIVYFMTTKRSLPYIRKITGKEEHSTIHNIMIMGGSRIAMRATQLVSDAMSVKIIENDLSRCHWLTDMVDDSVMIINGDGRDYELLEEEGIGKVDAFVALTDSSETNILACLSAKRMGVFKTIAEVENIDYIGMAESLDIGAVINKKKIAASYIYQLLLDADVENVKCLTFANADVAEFIVKEGARVTRSLVKDIALPKGVTIGGLVRGDEGILVTGHTQIQAGDHVVVFCLSSMIKRIEKYFN
ncbi:MAG: Trk system potassium transporter TrkA [Bacteroidaceae bacterium]|jgi:trk system potassium uptake protein TrkA|nr:Trk system potassium transporter TrkA [Bacteroidaceae bacterium]